jgi:hypothetical protein
MGLALSILLGLTEYWVQSGEQALLQRAIRWTPWNPQPYLMLAEIDAANAEAHLRRASELAPFDARTKIRLALELEMKGRLTEAKKLLHDAVSVDRTFQPEWSLANFFYRREDWDGFWAHARQAAAVPHADLGALYDMCLRLRRDPDWLIDKLGVTGPEASRQLLDAAVRHNLAATSLRAGEKAAVERGVKTRAVLQSALQQALDAGNVRQAIAYWNLLTRHRHLDQTPIEHACIVNESFGGELAGLGFDWQAMHLEGVEIRGGDGIRIRMSGKQPAEGVFLRQRAPVEPGHRYKLRYRYRASFNETGAPARWGVDGTEGRPLTGQGWREGTLEFTAKREWAEVQLATRREPGTVRPDGELEVAWIRMEEIMEAGSDSAKSK